MDVAALLASVPTPSAEDMLHRRDWARHYTLVFLRTGPTPHADEARDQQLHLHREHRRMRRSLHHHAEHTCTEAFPHCQVCPIKDACAFGRQAAAFGDIADAARGL